jgi:integrase
MPLTDRQCQTAKPKLKPYKLSDFEGLYLEVMPSGSKYWRLKYRLHGKEKRIGLGVYPKVALAKAREKKDEIRENIKQGINPTLSRLEAKQMSTFANADTFKAIALEWYPKQFEKWDPRYAQTVLHRLEKYLFPEIGSYPIKMIKPLTVLSCLQKIEKTGPAMARRIKQYCRYIFLYAIATGRLESDPTYGLEYALKKYKKGHFASIDIDKLPEFLIDLHEFRARITRQTFLAIKLMLLTFLRTKELVQGKWFEIDFEKAIWIVPAERMKMKRDHIVPLSRQTIKILEELKELNGKRDYILPSLSKPRQPMSKGTILMAIKRMKYDGKMTGHGFRALAMGVLKEKLGYSHELVDRQLAHARKNGVDKAYDRATFLPQRVEMMQKYANYLDEIFLAKYTF